MHCTAQPRYPRLIGIDVQAWWGHGETEHPPHEGEGWTAGQSTVAERRCETSQLSEGGASVLHRLPAVVAMRKDRPL